MADPLVSIIIPTYNRAQYICEAIDSVLSQTYKNIEIIVIDDGSIDNTRDLLLHYGSRIIYTFQNNAGPSSARNNGISLSKGELIAFLDSDDLWMPEKLNRQIPLIEQSQDIGIVGCGIYYINSMGDIISGPLIRSNYKKKKSFIKELRVHNCMRGGISGVLIRKECFDRLGVFDKELWTGEDWDMWFRIAEHYEIKYVEEPLIKIRQHENNLSEDIQKIDIEKRKQLIKKINKGHLITRRKGYSSMYLGVARKYMASQDPNKKKKILENIIRAILAYPLKSHSKDYKYRILFKYIFPHWFYNFLRKLN